MSLSQMLDALERLEAKVDLLRSERDLLRNEVVHLRGTTPCDWRPLDTPPGERRAWRCTRCKQVCDAPVHAYFAPCSGSRPARHLTDGSAVDRPVHAPSTERGEDEPRD